MSMDLKKYSKDIFPSSNDIDGHAIVPKKYVISNSNKELSYFVKIRGSSDAKELYENCESRNMSCQTWEPDSI